MARADLLALTESALAQMANAGLVKRALRDLAAGQAPEMTEAADGTIEARFADGAITRLPPRRTPAEASCSCPSSSMCRHRVTLVLAYQQRETAEAPAAASEEWDPAALDLEGFETCLPASVRSELERLLASPLTVRLERGRTPKCPAPDGQRRSALEATRFVCVIAEASRGKSTLVSRGAFCPTCRMPALRWPAP